MLGHVKHVSEDRVKTESSKTATVANWKTPTNISELRSLGLVSYYRRFITFFAKIAKPLQTNEQEYNMENIQM